MPLRFNNGSSGKDGDPQSRSTSVRRPHGRITKEDIRAARLRRWNGRSRITTDWLNLYQEPELSFPSGDVLVYLRQPGQSSRGPAYRIHSDVLETRGFKHLLERCIRQPPLHAARECLLKSCPGCDQHSSLKELYIPAPVTSNIDTVFDHHIATRNFFAWLYDVPLAGRALGRSLLAVKDRIDQYRRHGGTVLNKKEMIAYCESQKYLDFRECVDHALAALCLAENLQQEDMWIDAFAHVVGMSNRDLTTSLEYGAISPTVQSLIVESRLEMDVRMARASMSIETFFGDDLSGHCLGLAQSARDHFDRFRSFLHGFYIDKFGFWPPAGFSNESTRFSIYMSLYSELRDLYHHLVDPESSADATENLLSTGGICTLQNIQVFDNRHGFDTLPQPLPRLPAELSFDSRTTVSQRRRSWNPVTQKRMDRATRKALKIESLIKASNRDMAIMNRPLVRRYSEYEIDTLSDELEQIHWIEGRKVRWILIYAILQTLISVMAAPKHVRNTEGLSYSLCCHIPTRMPWIGSAPPQRAQSAHREIVPDVNYLHGNSSTGHIDTRSSRSTERADRRQTLPLRSNSVNPRSPSLPRVSGSLKRLLSRTRSTTTSDKPPVPALPPTAFCEILVQGYGNGLNEVDMQSQPTMTLPSELQMKHRSLVILCEPSRQNLDDQHAPLRMPHQGEEDVPVLSPTGSGSVSRESSNASTASSKTAQTEMEVRTPTEAGNVMQLDLSKRYPSASANMADSFIYDEVEGLPGSIHINTATWDEILAQ